MLTPPLIKRNSKTGKQFFFTDIRFGFFTCAFLLFPVLQTSAQNSIPPIGEWRDHLNSQQTSQVIKGDQIYCSASSHIFYLTEKNETGRFSKTNGLNDVGIQYLGWDITTRQLVIAYSNSNLDILKDGVVKNISDIKRSRISGNKTINSIFCNNGLAYLSSGLGIIVADLQKFEIKDTWVIGNNGTQVKTNAFTSDGSFFYAATEEGLKTTSVNTNNPSNYNNWQLAGTSNGLGTGPVKNVLQVNGKMVAEKNDSLFILNGTNWQLLYADKNWPITNTTSSHDKLLVCQRTISGNARVMVLNSAGQVEQIIAQPNVISFPRSAIIDGDAVWVADQFGGLSKFNPGAERFIPNGPPGPADGEMLVKNNRLYAAAGSINSAWNYQYNRNGVYFFEQDIWSSKSYYNERVLDSVLDFISLAVDPSDKSLWAGSYGGGLVNFSPSKPPVIYKKNNSSLQAAIGDPASYRVSGLAFDQNRNLWISNYGAPKNIQVRKSDGSWQAFSIPFSHLENAVGQIIIDDQDQLWIQSPKDNGLFCFSHGQNIDNTADDQWKFYRSGVGNGNLPSNTVLSILKDKNGFIWVGTDKGIGIIQCPDGVFNGTGCDAILPIVQLDRFAGLLFRDEAIQCMAVDGANRKWIGTKNGLWLISPDGDKIIYRFTEENSPLLNNDVKKITIDPATGEVFIATISGICSFRSTATEGDNTNSNILVFPNPVPPGYQGTIAIRGLVNNALVKITEMNGRLVFQTRALGGQAIWDGRNYRGEKVASGIYLVLIRDDNGSEKVATKIAISSGR
ncbi:MAG: T9SS type A sorting domain-containing protein [Bacteroidetes bacterium]|nr:T9SS type A sorting domain-containing protein [Bacteroidota bacterium]